MPANQAAPQVGIRSSEPAWPPRWRAIINTAGKFAASTNVELTPIYANRANALSFRDITWTTAIPYGALFSAAGYDLCPGVGSDPG
jgi:hypothetical protein